MNKSKDKENKDYLLTLPFWKSYPAETHSLIESGYRVIEVEIANMGSVLIYVFDK